MVTEGNAPTFVINAGKTVSFVGFNIENIDTSTPVIENDGDLTITDVNIIASTLNVNVSNTAAANLTIKGECNFTKD